MGGMKVCVKKEKDWNKEKWYDGRARLFESEIELDLMFPFSNILQNLKRYFCLYLSFSA
jgi:hypothetical protein